MEKEASLTSCLQSRRQDSLCRRPGVRHVVWAATWGSSLSRCRALHAGKGDAGFRSIFCSRPV